METTAICSGSEPKQAHRKSHHRAKKFDLQNGDIDGIVVDLPTAFFMAAVQIDKGVVVGQFGTESDEYFAMAFDTGSPLVECVNLALAEMTEDGTLDAIEERWLADKTNAPVLD